MNEVRPDDEENLQHPAEGNPWYLLATVYGKPEKGDEKLNEKNRVAWNRYMATKFASKFTEEYIRELTTAGHHLEGDLKPLSYDEIEEIEEAFRKRKPSSLSIKIFDVDVQRIVFSNIFFDEITFTAFWFPLRTEFDNVIFLDNAFFGGATFSGESSFLKVVFTKSSILSSAIFRKGVSFDNARFSRKALFHDVKFYEGVSFKDATFDQNALFKRAGFSEFVTFEDAKFSDEASFDDAKFSAPVVFTGATFKNVWFDKATFCEAVFNNVTFSGSASFDDAKFSKRAWFNGAKFQAQVSFVNAEMKGPTSFNAYFGAYPPDFSGAELHQGTSWHGATWPNQPTDVEQAVKFVQAYERLKLEMDRLKKHEDELDFFALEMKSRRLLQDFWGRLTTDLYEFVCDFGRNYRWPLAGLLITVFPGSFPFWLCFGYSELMKALGLGLANTFAALGFRKDFIKPELVEALPSALKFWAGVQSVAGIVLLFFFVLALRNRFRMR